MLPRWLGTHSKHNVRKRSRGLRVKDIYMYLFFSETQVPLIHLEKKKIVVFGFAFGNLLFKYLPSSK